MTSTPRHPKIYHITQVGNLASIGRSGVLWSDAKRVELGLDFDIVGMSHIKHRRMNDLEVGCHPGTKVGDYTPFYFCPRSIMLYILHRGNHPDLTYTGGQEPIVHLQADLNDVVDWAGEARRRWAFSDCNAGASYATFYSDLARLGELNWNAIQARVWTASSLKEGKQAEFLIEASLPWELVEYVGVCTAQVQQQVRHALADSDHQPPVVVEPEWYY